MPRWGHVRCQCHDTIYLGVSILCLKKKYKKKLFLNYRLLFSPSLLLYLAERERCQWAMLAGLRAMPDWVSGRQTPESSQPSEHRATICLGLGLTWRTTFPLSSHSQTGLPANGFRPWKGLENALADIRYKLYHITDIF